MLLEDKIEVIPATQHFTYYESLGYVLPKNENGQVPRKTHLIIRVEHLPKYSHFKVKAKCDGCGKEILVNYYNYTRQKLQIGDYCKFCFSKTPEFKKRAAESARRTCNRWDGGIKYNHGYKTIRDKNHHRSGKYGYVAEHIYIAENKIGRKLFRDEVVHHINGIKDDNRSSNLLVLTKSEHRKLHERLGFFTLNLIKQNKVILDEKLNLIWNPFEIEARAAE